MEESDKLGSMLGDQEDILRRKTLATAAMNKMDKVWVRNRNISIKKRLKLYNVLVKPILMYNSSTWGLTKKDMESLDAFHRKQLKKIWKIKWKQKITNKNLYEMSNAKPLSYEIARQRWKLFGHILRIHKETPAQRSMKYYFENHENLKKFQGRQRETIVTTLDRDIEMAYGLNAEMMKIRKLRSYRDIETLQEMAADRCGWRKIVTLIIENFY